MNDFDIDLGSILAHIDQCLDNDIEFSDVPEELTTKLVETKQLISQYFMEMVK